MAYLATQFGMFTNLAVLFICLLFVIWRYSKGYEDGIACTVFLMAVLPGSVGLEIGGSLPSLTFHRLALLITLLNWARNQQIPKSVRGLPFSKLMVLSAVFFFVSTCLSSFPLVSFKQYTYYVIEFVVFFFVVQTSSIQETLVTKVMSALGLGLLTVAILAFAERYLNFRVSTFLPYSGSDYGVSRFTWAGGDDGSITVSYRHRILLGIACALGALKYLADSAFAKDRRILRKKLLCAFICGGALYFSLSRGPWLAFIFSCLLMILVLPRRFLKPAMTLVGITALLLVVRPGIWTTIEGLGNSTMDKSSVRGSSFRWRQQVFELATTKISESGPLHFLFGYGGGSTIMTDFGKIETSAGDTLPMESWDCEIAIILYERGTVGFTLAILLFGGALIRTGSCLIKSKPNADPTLTFTFAALCVFCFMMTNVAIYAIQLIYIEALILAIASRYIIIQRQVGLFGLYQPQYTSPVLNGAE